MIVMLRLALVLLGLLFVWMGFGFLTNPVIAGGDFGLQTNGPQGLSSIRGDLTAYFWVAGGALLYGAWQRKGDLLLVPAALLGITFAARAVSVVVDGAYDGWPLPMAVEALTVVLALIGSRVLPHSALDPD